MIFERIKSLIGLEKFKKLQSKSIAVIGLGGVGGTACIALARSGIENFVICDFDTIEESNINRQIVANSKNIGRFKTDEIEKMLININPNINITKITNKFDVSLFNEKIDFVIDAIDDIEAKKELISECINRKIKFISSMGAAKKMDPTKVEIIKLSKTTYDPIAKILRNYFKNKDFYVVSSSEELKDIADLGSYMPVVSTFSLYLTDYAIKQLIK